MHVDGMIQGAGWGEEEGRKVELEAGGSWENTHM